MARSWWGFLVIFNKRKEVVSFLAFFFLSGFRPMAASNPWELNRLSPYLFVKLCSESEGYRFSSYNVPTDDPFGMSGEQEVRSLIQSVLADYNGIESSYLQLIMLPEDGEPLPDEAQAAGETLPERTIEICLPDETIGAATFEWSGEKAVGCLIEIGGADAKASEFFVGLLSHEMGHCLGLLHPQETRESVLSYFASGGLYRLQLDDKMGITYLYNQNDENHFEQTLGLACAPKKS